MSVTAVYYSAPSSFSILSSSLSTLSSSVRSLSSDGMTTINLTQSMTTDVSTAGRSDLNSHLDSDWLPWNNPQNIISQSVERAFYVVLSCGFNLTVCLIGIPANTLNLIVFAKQVGNAGR